MGRIILRHFSLFAGFIFLALAFQNCAQDLDLTAYEKNSSTTTPPAPIPTIATQSPAAITVQENGNQQLFITVSNLTGYTVSWYKNGTLITGATTETLNFSPVRLTDAGSYQAKVTAPAPSTVVLDSLAIVLAVTPDPSDRVYLNHSFAFGGVTYFTYGFAGNPQFTADNATAYCKSQLGPTSTLVAYQLKAAAEATPNFAFAYSLDFCNSYAPAVAYQNGFCLANIAGLSLTRFQSITCKP